jgi:hypothetical protein
VVGEWYHQYELQVAPDEVGGVKEAEQRSPSPSMVSRPGQQRHGVPPARCSGSRKPFLLRFHGGSSTERLGILWRRSLTAAGSSSLGSAKPNRRCTSGFVNSSHPPCDNHRECRMAS